MKLSKQERIATIVILILVILGVGIFVFIKPAFEGLGATQKNLENKQAEYNADVEKAGRKADLRTQIEEAYKEGEHLADMFFPELTSYEADEAMRKFLAQCTANVVVEALEVEEPTTSVLSPYFSISEEVVYELKSYATQGADPDEEQARKISRLTELQTALGSAQTIGASTVSFTVSAIDRDELLKFADEVNNYIVKENGKDTRKAIMLNGMAFECPEIEKEYAAKVEEINSEAEKVGKEALERETGKKTDDKVTTSNPDGETSDDKEGKVDVNECIYKVETSITFFSIERMQDPKTQLDKQDGAAA
ncbi:MAG: hypothetical protein ACI4JZ_09650 [Oscillospiraceae bacterium]